MLNNIKYYSSKYHIDYPFTYSLMLMFDDITKLSKFCQFNSIREQAVMNYYIKLIFMNKCKRIILEFIKLMNDCKIYKKYLKYIHYLDNDYIVKIFKSINYGSDRRNKIIYSLVGNNKWSLAKYLIDTYIDFLDDNIIIVLGKYGIEYGNNPYCSFIGAMAGFQKHIIKKYRDMNMSKIHKIQYKSFKYYSKLRNEKLILNSKYYYVFDKKDISEHVSYLQTNKKYTLIDEMYVLMYGNVDDYNKLIRCELDNSYKFIKNNLNRFKYACIGGKLEVIDAMGLTYLIDKYPMIVIKNGSLDIALKLNIPIENMLKTAYLNNNSKLVLQILKKYDNI